MNGFATFKPDRWLSSLMDALEGQMRYSINEWMGVEDSSNVVEISLTHLGSERETSEDIDIGDLDKLLVTVNIDDLDNQALGFGNNVVSGEITEPTEDEAGKVLEYAARMHMVNIDLGIIASDKAGGSSARLQGYEMLDSMFGSPFKRQRFRELTDGIEIVSFTGGRFAKDTINDIRVFRVVGAELVVRVYSRDVASDEIIIVDDVIQNPSLVIGDPSVPIDDDE